MIETTLKELDLWFNDAGVFGDRSKYLSKLAVLELCGWIEGEFDRLLLDAQRFGLNDEAWCSANVVKKTYGFEYTPHLRKMLVAVFGEVGARKIEARMEDIYPGDLARLKTLLGSLWVKRCSFAHQDFGAHLAAQQRFDAPSWAISEFKTVKALVAKLEWAVHETFAPRPLIQHY